MSALAQPPIDAAQIYNNAVRAIFSRWTLLRLAVDQGWADGDEAQKANELVERVLELVAPTVRRPPDESEIADFLHDAIEGTFNSQAEDGSVEEIAQTIMRLRAECAAGDVANAQAFIAAATAASDLGASVGREDEAGEVEEAAPRAPAPLPVIDEDGFESIPARRRPPPRACAP
jgi:pre-rRNA-processing protein TSR2